MNLVLDHQEESNFLPQMNDLFDESTCQVSRQDNNIKIFHQINLKELLSRSLQNGLPSEITKEDLGDGQDNRSSEGVLGEKSRFNYHNGKIKMVGPVYLKYRLRVISIKKDTENESEEHFDKLQKENSDFSSVILEPGKIFMNLEEENDIVNVDTASEAEKLSLKDKVFFLVKFSFDFKFVLDHINKRLNLRLLID